MYDVMKAFDHLDWRVLLEAAKQLSFPLMLLRFLIHLYSSTRHIIIGKGIVRVTQPRRSVVAGCTFADIMMFLVMKIIDAKVRRAAPAAFTAVVADDFQFLVIRSKDLAISTTLAAHAATRKAFLEAGLPISVKKQVLLGSDEKALAEIVRADETLNGSRRRTARNLGVDFTLGKRRYTMVFAARALKSKKKILKIRTIRAVGVDTSHYVTSLINSGHMYAMDCIGASPSQIRICRRAAHRGTTRNPAGRSATFDLALGRARATLLEPSYRLNSAPIIAIASALWDGWVPRQWILRPWRETFASACDANFRWNAVNDGLTAAAATCRRINWTSAEPGAFLTDDGVKINCDIMCPRSIRTLCDRSVERHLLRKTTETHPTLRNLGPGAVPWVLPLKRLIDQKTTASWTPLHQSLLRCAVADGLWTAERLHKAGIVDSGDCYVCGAPGTVFHRLCACPARFHFCYNYGLPDGLLRNARSSVENPLWTRALVADPTRQLPPPSDSLPEWTVLQENGLKQFDGPGFGDGSGVSPFGGDSTRCGFSVVQTKGGNGSFSLAVCLLGPLPGIIQSTPAAEATAFLYYLRYANDKKTMVFYSDCQWVVDCFHRGPSCCTGALHVHADIWRQIWRINDARTHRVICAKVKAHASAADMAAGYDQWLKEGNSYADAGAKLGRSRHPREPDLEKKACKAYVLVQMLGRFIARSCAESMRAGDDVPPHDRNLKKIRKEVCREKTRSPKHAIVEDNERFRCLWCLKSAATSEALKTAKCSQAGGHNLWRSSGITICSRCGGYSQFSTRLLGAECTGTAVGSRKHWLKRVFSLHLHPVEDKRIQRPVFWKSCAQQQLVEQDPQALAEDCNVENCPDYLLPQSILALADTFVSDDDCKLRGYIVSEADAVKYSDAVIGASDKVDVNGMKISHVGEPTRSSSSVNWEPWVGQRTLRPITVAHTGRGSTIRNRFCLSADERNRRKLDLDAKRRAAETILESSESCDFADRMPDVDSTKWHLAGDHEDLHGIPEDLFDDYDFDDPGESVAILAQAILAQVRKPFSQICLL